MKLACNNTSCFHACIMMCVRSNTPCMPSTQTSLRAVKLLWRNVSHCREHGNSSVLQLGLASALEVLHTAVCGEASGIPKSNWVLHSELVLEGTQRRGGVVGPVSPRAASESVLHATSSMSIQLSATSEAYCFVGHWLYQAC